MLSRQICLLNNPTVGLWNANTMLMRSHSYWRCCARTVVGVGRVLNAARCCTKSFSRGIRFPPTCAPDPAAFAHPHNIMYWPHIWTELAGSFKSKQRRRPASTAGSTPPEDRWVFLSFFQTTLSPEHAVPLRPLQSQMSVLPCDWQEGSSSVVALHTFMSRWCWWCHCVERLFSL